jgi:Family of unknown function (DUF6463)
MRRYCGPLLMATGVLDVLYVLVFHYQQLAAIAGDGFFDAVDPAVTFSTFDRETAFWHLMFGAMAIVLGGLIHWLQARTGTLPAFLGWSLLTISVAALVLMPFSGFWLVLPQAVMMIVAARWGRSRSGSETKSGGMRRAAG